MNKIISYEAKRAIAIGRRNHWRFRVVSKAPEWVYEEVLAPTVALDRIAVLKRAGVPIKGFVIAHEAPKLLAAPKEEPKPPSPQILLDFSPLEEVLKFVGNLFLIAILLDPALIVVLEDGTWLEVMTWYE
jgi:hypothetical protein